MAGSCSEPLFRVERPQTKLAPLPQQYYAARLPPQPQPVPRPQPVRHPQPQLGLPQAAPRREFRATSDVSVAASSAAPSVLLQPTLASEAQPCAAVPVAEPVPASTWVTYYTADQLPYFYHVPTGITSWDFRQLPVAAPAAAAPVNDEPREAEPPPPQEHSAPQHTTQPLQQPAPAPAPASPPSAADPDVSTHDHQPEVIEPRTGGGASMRPSRSCVCL